MDNLLEQVGRARRRMMRNDFLAYLVWALFACLTVAVIAIAVPKVIALPDLPTRWAEGWLIGGTIVGVLAAIVVTFVRQRSTLDAAVEVDRRFDLRERVASSLTLHEADQDSEWGRALINDAVRSVERIDVGQEFPTRVGRRAWLPLIPAVIAFVLMTFVGNQDQADASSQKPNPATAEQVKKPMEELRKKIAKKISEAEEKKELKDAAALLKEVEKGIEEAAKKEDADQKKTTVKLNDLAKKLADRKRELGGTKALKNELNKLKDFGKGPADKAAEAMKDGNWEKALEEVAIMRKQLAEGKMSPEQQKKLAEQLSKMKQQLDSANEARKQAMEDLKQQIQEQRRKGNNAEAGKLQEKLDKLQQQQQQMEKLEELAKKMGQAQQAMEKGDQQAAAEAMDQMAEQLEQMKQEIDEMEMLEDAMDQIEMAKAQMGCQQCQGAGCQGCQGMGEGQGQGAGKGQGQGDGMGEGQGQGRRDENKNATNMRDSRVRAKPGAGSSVFGGLVKGPNIRGDVTEGLKQELSAEDVAPAEALDEERLPRSRREHAREYFEKLRKEL